MASSEAGMLRGVLAALALAIAAGHASADSFGQPGVWKGTLGKSAITVCFNKEPDYYASYYYQRYRTPIRLTKQTTTQTWVENGNTGFWNLDEAHTDTLTGTWRKASGARPLPVVLTRSSLEGCDGDDYNLPVEAALPPAKVERVTIDGHGYRVKTQATQVLALELEGNGAAIARINRELARLAAGDPNTETINQERRRFMLQYGQAETSEVIIEPVYRSSRWLTVRFYRWPAGYGANSISWGFHSWDLQTGESVDPWAWLGTHFSWYDSFTGGAKLPKPFADWLRTQVPADGDCPDVAGYETYDLTFDTQGMRLANQARGDGCEVDAAFSWQQLEPFLSAQGRQALGSLQEP
ncbi:hypothetical protein [Pseudomonas xanthosomatis]|uniref:hypothetical protein n=1 Tax=Pseudomonas xanthosomatis TaxID=2842356 RepID=UPI0035145268